MAPILLTQAPSQQEEPLRSCPPPTHTHTHTHIQIRKRIVELKAKREEDPALQDDEAMKEAFAQVRYSSTTW